MMVSVSIFSDLCYITKEFSPEVTLSELCNKLYNFTGIAPNDMKLRIENVDGNENIIYDKIMRTPDVRPLSTLSGSAISITVDDTNSNSLAHKLKDIHNTTSTDGEHLFKLSDAEYAGRTDSVLQWKKQNQLGKFDPKFQEQLEKHRQLQMEKVSNLELNQRCSVKTQEQLERRGWLRYIGKIPEISENDIWCGIEFDEPTGKNNGSFKGTVYFGPVNPNYGGFVKPVNLETGAQFTPFELDLDLDSDEEL